MKKVVIAGGNGFIGSYLATRCRETGYSVVVISRQPSAVSWDKNDLIEALNNAELVINVAGAPINCRHTAENKKAILESRMQSTRQIGEAIFACSNPPKLWINASGAGIYEPSENEASTEESTHFSNDFLGEVTKQWEKACLDFQLPETRQIVLRTSVVLGKHGGALSPLVWLSRLGLGGKQAEGKQIFSWLHIEDYFRIVAFLIKHPSIEGVVNATSPHPVTNSEFMLTMRDAVGMPFGIPAPRWGIILGAKLLGTEPNLILNSSYVIPQKLIDAGFEFAFPEPYFALVDLLR